VNLAHARARVDAVVADDQGELVAAATMDRAAPNTRLNAGLPGEDDERLARTAIERAGLSAP
jgi:uncharacterized protein GlcG (DUF336 family)